MELNHNSQVYFDPIMHAYWIGDKRLIGVTSLMRKHGLSPDYSGVKPEVLNHAAARGTAVHEATAEYDDGKPAMAARLIEWEDVDGMRSETIDVSEDLKAHANLVAEYGLKPIFSEYLVSDNELVASSIDMVSQVDEGMVDLVDKKTTSTIHPAVRWQLSIYAYLFELQNPTIKVRNLYCEHLRGASSKMVLQERISSEQVKRLFECERNGERFLPEDIKGTELAEIVGADTISTLLANEAAIAQAKEAIKVMESQIAEAHDRILAYMAERGLTKLPVEGGEYRMRAASKRESVDTKKLKEEMPDIAAKYIKTSQVKGSISFVGR